MTDWHWRPDVVIVVTLLSTAYVTGWRRFGFTRSRRMTMDMIIVAGIVVMNLVISEGLSLLLGGERSYDRPRGMEQDLRYGIVQFLILLIYAGTVPAVTQQERLPDRSLRPGTRITIPAGQERQILFRPEGVRFLSGRAWIVAVGDPLIGPDGHEIREFVIDADRSPGTPWIHHDKPLRLRIRAETDFTLEARESWEWDPRRESSSPAILSATSPSRSLK